MKDDSGGVRFENDTSTVVETNFKTKANEEASSMSSLQLTRKPDGSLHFSVRGTVAILAVFAVVLILVLVK